MNGTSRSGLGPALAGLLTAAALMGCAARREPPSFSTPVRIYAARLQVTAEAKGRGMSLAAGVAVDPVRGARLELRDPMGATLLLLWITPAEGRILSPDGRQEARWDGAGEALPWSPGELWSLLTGALPPNARSIRRSPEGTITSARWANPLGAVSLHAQPEAGKVFPPVSATLSGPGPARLSVRWRSISDGAPPAAAFEPPPRGEDVPLAELVGQVLR